MSFFEENRTALENFRKVSSSVGARADYVQGGGGNTSVKLEGGLMAIIAYAMNKKVVNATPEAVVPEGELFPAVPDNGFSA